MKYQGKESDFQKTVAAYLNSYKVLWSHVPNEAKRSRATGAELKRQGLKRGVPDILIFEPRGGYSGMAIELKVGYNKPTYEQHEWLRGLKRCGWKVMWSNDLYEVINEIDNYLSQDETKRQIK